MRELSFIEEYVTFRIGKMKLWTMIRTQHSWILTIELYTSAISIGNSRSFLWECL